MINLTKEKLRQNAAAMLAHANGKPIEWKQPWGEWQETKNLGLIASTEYRPKPEPVMRHWSKPSDVPAPICWLRVSGYTMAYMVVAVYDTGLCFHMNGMHGDISWDSVGRYEYSTDCKTWHKCEVSE